MSPEQKRKFNTVFGSLFIFSGLVTWGLTVYYAVTPAAPKPHPVVLAASVDLNSCRSTLGAMGYRVDTAGDKVKLFEALAERPQDQLQKATLAASLCKMEMTDFCMGEGCEEPGVALTLVKRKAPVVAPKSSSPAAASAPAAPASKKK